MAVNQADFQQIIDYCRPSLTHLTPLRTAGVLLRKPDGEVYTGTLRYFPPDSFRSRLLPAQFQGTLLWSAPGYRDPSSSYAIAIGIGDPVTIALRDPNGVVETDQLDKANYSLGFPGELDLEINSGSGQYWLILWNAVDTSLFESVKDALTIPFPKIAA